MQQNNITLDASEISYFNEQLTTLKQEIHNRISHEKYKKRFMPAHIYEGAHVYLERTGKAFRPVYLMWCAGALGGEQRLKSSILAACAIEIYHTWGLVHDDIIDQDVMRRGGPTVHKWFEDRAISEMNYSPSDAERYGLSVGILAGDALMAWSVGMICEMYEDDLVDPSIPQNFIQSLVTEHIPTLIDGEMLDIQFEQISPEKLTTDDLLDMSLKKTGSIFMLAALAGGTIGLNKWDPSDPQIDVLVQFAKKTGLGFQIIDDVINIVGDANNTGKGVGTDIVLGKRTIPIIETLNRASGKELDTMLSVFGNLEATDVQVNEAIEIIKSSGSVDFARKKAFDLASEALNDLEIIPDSKYLNLIQLMGRRLVDRGI